MLLVATGWLYWATPYSADNGEHDWRITDWIGQGLRYALPFLAMLAVATALVATSLARRFARAGPIGVGICAAASVGGLLSSAPARILNDGIAAGPMLLLLALASLSVLTGRARRTAAAALVVAGLASSSLARQLREDARQEIYGGTYGFLQRVPPEATVAYACAASSYPLYGRAFERRVVPLPESLPPSEWAAFMRGRGSALLVVGPWPEGAFAEERARLEDREGAFTRILGSDPTREPLVYRLEAPTSARPRAVQP
jgi:hypothetical protein